MSEPVPDSVRDELMLQILTISENHLCFDCGAKNPNWASAYLGILLCIECAARHRSYGTHISFIRSIDLDKWNKKQLKSIEIAGNGYAKDRFSDLGVPKQGTIYDYTSELVQKYKNELADRVKILLNAETKNTVTAPAKNTTKKTENEPGLIKKIEEVNFDDAAIPMKIESNSENTIKESEYSMPTKFEINEAANIKVITSEGKVGKSNKIKKVDFEFNFDSFNDINFSEFGNNSNLTSNSTMTSEAIPAKEKNKRDMDNNDDDDYKNNNNYYNKPKISQEVINKKFANKKAISSEDFAQLEDSNDGNDEYKGKLSSMKNANAISSSDMYGEKNDDDGKPTFGSKMKEYAYNITMKAAEKAKEASEIFNRTI